MFSSCPCCISSVIFGSILFSVILFKVLSLISNNIIKNKQKNLIGKFFHFLFLLTSFIILLISIFLGILSVSPTISSQFFANLCGKLTQSNELNPLRCGLVSNINGRVLEFGFGPGTNFRCWTNNSNIVEWVGVDPNIHFNDLVLKQKENYNITFSTNIVWLEGENVNVEEQSFDYVIATHTLCSVNDVNQVLKQISRALKPGGKYLFFEHVTAPTNSHLYYLQLLMSPFLKIVGNGCQFRELWKNINSSNEPSSPFFGYDVKIEHINAPISLPPLTPHIIGEVNKPLE